MRNCTYLYENESGYIRIYIDDENASGIMDLFNSKKVYQQKIKDILKLVLEGKRLIHQFEKVKTLNSIWEMKLGKSSNNARLCVKEFVNDHLSSIVLIYPLTLKKTQDIDKKTMNRLREIDKNYQYDFERKED